ncbi:MAG: M23 family metallopeptidase [Elainellaceae cyanobacterium]
MIQRHNIEANVWRTSQRRWLVGSLSWLTGMGLLGNPIVLAQTSPSSSTSVPSAQDLLTSDELEAASSTSSSSKQNDAQPNASSNNSVTLPEQIPSERSPSNSPDDPASAVPPLDPADLNADRPTPTRVGTTDYSTVYIDTTDYSLGATNQNQDIPSIVLSERSTGCQAVVEQGQTVPANICGSAESVASALGYAAGNRRGTVSSVNVGPLSIGPNGVSLNRSQSVWDYYNQTSRPAAMSGNGNSRLLFPLSIPAMISSPFGWRVHPIFGSERFHTGTDLAAPMGTPVVAAYAGQVAIADLMRGYGLTVVLRHNDATQETLYGHLSELFVKPGEWVDQGEVIGRVGSTGNSTGPHLHFELREATSDGWLALNAGEILQVALAHFGSSFQLVSADTTPLEKDINLLEVPETLQSGKNAIKTTSTDFQALVKEEKTSLNQN